jgi:hypothetical protein
LFRHLLLQIGGANIAVFDCSLRSRDVRWVASVFVGSGGTEKRCSAISSCRSAAANIAGADRAWRPLLRRLRRRKKRVGSFLLSTAARDPGFRQSSLIQYMRTG